MSKSKILFATNNEHKVSEINDILSALNIDIELVTMKSLGIDEDIPENGNTLEENALTKSRFLHKLYPEMAVIGEDTGLEVAALANKPGVHTAKYAGEARDPEANMKKLLEELKQHSNRNARFRTVIAYKDGADEVIFEGIVNGEIAHKKTGTGGFGYDPIFIPEGYDKSFACLGSEIKNKISHRASAVEKLIDFLKRNKLIK